MQHSPGSDHGRQAGHAAFALLHAGAGKRLGARRGRGARHGPLGRQPGREPAREGMRHGAAGAPRARRGADRRRRAALGLPAPPGEPEAAPAGPDGRHPKGRARPHRHRRRGGLHRLADAQQPAGLHALASGDHGLASKSAAATRSCAGWSTSGPTSGCCSSRPGTSGCAPTSRTRSRSRRWCSRPIRWRAWAGR